MRRSFFVCATLLVLAIVVPAAAQSDPWLDEDFSGSISGWSEPYGMNPTDDGHVGPGLLSDIPAGEHWGSRAFWMFEDNIGFQPEELYWRYWVKFDEDNYIRPPDRGKLPGPTNLFTYNCLGSRPSTPAEPCWSARMMWSRDYPKWPEDGPTDGRDGETRIGFYVYHVDQPADWGESWDWEHDLSIVQNGTWMCLEGHIAMNAPGVADGELRGWIDGQLAFDRDDLRFRRAAEGHLNIESFWFDVYYGGTNPSPQDNFVTFDSLAFGPERIGCDDSFQFDGTFWDDDDSVFEADIEWLVSRAITQGCDTSGIRFCPDDRVTRGQMAAFLARALDLPASSRDWFADDDGSTFEDDINKIADAGITLGCGGSRYCVDDFVTRGQMAAFLVRTYDLPPGGSIEFTDDDGSTFEGDIEALAEAGVTLGCADGRYCPVDFVTRGQMAAFLHRADGV